jgi:hypothetical protein
MLCGCARRRGKPTEAAAAQRRWSLVLLSPYLQTNIAMEARCGGRALPPHGQGCAGPIGRCGLRLQRHWLPTLLTCACPGHRLIVEAVRQHLRVLQVILWPAREAAHHGELAPQSIRAADPCCNAGRRRPAGPRAGLAPCMRGSQTSAHLWPRRCPAGAVLFLALRCCSASCRRPRSASTSLWL